MHEAVGRPWPQRGRWLALRSISWLPLAASIVLAPTGCQQPSSTTTASLAGLTNTIYTPENATGFRILGGAGRQSTVIESLNPWQGAHGAVRRLLLLRGGEAAPEGYEGPSLVADSVTRIAVLSTSHVAMLSQLGATGCVVAASGVRLICDSSVRARLAADPAAVAEIGHEGDADLERLLTARPQVVLLYGLLSPSPLEGQLERLHIPYLYIGDYLEPTPLGKEEWLVAVGELLGRRRAAADTARAVAARYRDLHLRMMLCSTLPGVMVNAPYSDVWYMPSRSSYFARLIGDAAGRYLYEGETGSRSGTIDIEEAARLLTLSDVWLLPGQCRTLSELRRTLPSFADVRCVASGDVWNATRRRNADGGNDYWESGAMRPDVVLHDLAHILHPYFEVGEPYYFERLE